MTNDKMKLWRLEPRNDLPAGNPWIPCFDTVIGLIVRARTEDRAREIAQEVSLDESRRGITSWLDPAYSTCEELMPEGEEGVIVRDTLEA